MYKVLIVSDSRGKRLETTITPPSDTKMIYKVENGLTLQAATGIVKHELKSTAYTCVYIFAGICSITKKEKGHVYLPFESTEDIIETTTHNIKIILKELDDEYTTPIVLCSIPGVDIAKANDKKATDHHPLQDDLNRAMIDINDFIMDINLTRGFSTPMVAATIHKCHGRKKDGNKKYRHHLNKLDDGIHPTNSTLKMWCRKLEENFSQFLFNPSQL